MRIRVPSLNPWSHTVPAFSDLIEPDTLSDTLADAQDLAAAIAEAQQ